MTRGVEQLGPGQGTEGQAGAESWSWGVNQGRESQSSRLKRVQGPGA